MSNDRSSDSPDPSTPPGSYVVVARRYRPKSFQDLVGQQQLAQALINAITTNRVGHAYLFTGARGVGKTSTARIFAKSLNAPDGPTPHPDNDTDICRAIDAGEDVDVLEIDGASNRGIEEIRQLRSNANVRPSRARFKIYIIDEVHMLTTPAFNALLKTLEEPPAHVKFIFCTTDPQKIPITVLSRCQRYDFAPIEANDIAQRLADIVASEGREAEPEALQLLARRVEGSMRDSQSLLEQLLAYCSGKIRAEDVNQMLGTADSQRLVGLASRMVERDAAGALQQLDQAVTDGIDAGQLTEQLLGFFRDVMAAHVGCSPDLMRHTDSSDHESLTDVGRRLGLETTLAVLQILDQANQRMRLSSQPRILLELAIVRICNLGDLDQLAKLIGELRDDSGPKQRQTPKRSQQPTRKGGSKPAAATSKEPPAESEKNFSPGEQNQLSGPTQPPKLTELTPESADTVWKQVLEEIEDMTADFASYYDHVAISGPNVLVVHFRERYTLQKASCERPDRKALLERSLQQVVGHPVQLELVSIPATQQAPEAPAPSMFQLKREKEKHPFVKQAVDLFGGELIRVDIPPAASNGLAEPAPRGGKED